MRFQNFLEYSCLRKGGGILKLTWCYYFQQPIEDVLNNILNKIPTSHQHTCATYFFGIAQQITEKDKDEVCQPIYFSTFNSKNRLLVTAFCFFFQLNYRNIFLGGIQILLE